MLNNSPHNTKYLSGTQTYNLNCQDDILNVDTTTGVVTIVLPNIINNGLDSIPKRFYINDVGNNASANNITLVSLYGNTINSSSSIVLNTNGISVELFQTSNIEWFASTSNGGSSGGVQSIVAGTNIQVDSTDPLNPIVSTNATKITVVANYSALPIASTVPTAFYWCSASQGTKWLPFSIGGTYYPLGLYYSNGVTWEFIEVPYQSTQAQVDAGTNTDTFVTPNTFENASKWLTKQNTIIPQALTETDDTNVTLTFGGTPSSALLQAVSMVLGWTGLLSIARGGTNSGTTLLNNRVMRSSGGAIVEASAITPARALISDANGIPTQGVATATELGYLSGATSAIQTQLGNKLNLIAQSSTDGTLVSGTAVNTLSQSILIPANTFTIGSIFQLFTVYRFTGTTAVKVVRLYVNTTSTLAGATLVGTNGATIIASSLYAIWGKIFVIKSAIVTEVGGTAGNTGLTIEGVATAVSSVNIDWTVNQYLIMALQINVADTGVVSAYKLTL